MKVLDLDVIKKNIDIDLIEKRLVESFISYSRGEAQIPTPGELLFPNHKGECHIKYGHLEGAPYFVIKVATGFFGNLEKGLTSGSGMMSIWCASTGRPLAVLQDEGYLTDLRTAIAGRIVVRHLAPKSVSALGVIGTGTQARMQIQFLKGIIPCVDLIVYGRDKSRTEAYVSDMTALGYSVTSADSISELCQTTNVIVTTTPSKIPLIHQQDIVRGCHITAVGSDGNGKQEVHEDVFRSLDLCVVDSEAQCAQFGDLSFALQSGAIELARVTELGELLQSPHLYQRANEDQVTFADLTGVACQDIAIATAVYESFLVNGC